MQKLQSLSLLKAMKFGLFQLFNSSKQTNSKPATYKSEEEQTRDKLEAFMQAQQPYLQNDLTLGALAKMLSLKPVVLSRVINEYYQKNFFDFINSYRIQHFIEIAPLAEHSHKTLLGIALEVGFNSKSTFNRAFKKEYSVPPTTYFRQTGLVVG
jgi:AraC-like DNA-binding protein